MQCTCATSSFHGFLLRVLGLRLRHLPYPSAFLFFCLLFLPTFLPHFAALLPSSNTVATLSLFCSYVLLVKQYKPMPSVSPTLLRLSEPKLPLPHDWLHPSPRPRERNGLLFVLQLQYST